MNLYTLYRRITSTGLLVLSTMLLLAMLPQHAAHALPLQPAAALPNQPAQVAAWPPCAVIPGELVLFGAADEIDALLASLTPSNLQLKQSTTMGWMAHLPADGGQGGGGDDDDDDDDNGDDNFVFKPASDDDGTDIMLNLYAITDGASVEDMVTTTLPAALAQDASLEVIAAPNCQTGSHGHSAVGSPALKLGPSAHPAYFLSQRALGTLANGLGIYSGLERQVAPTGAGVRVAVLDTSPFSSTIANGTTGREVISFASLAQSGAALPPLDLQVSHAITLTELDPAPGNVNMANHGLFVAGQIHAVAPESDIALYRVLDEYGNGDMYTISAAVSHFVESAIVEGSIPCSVINMSLGIVTSGATDPTTLEPLYSTLQAAHERGVVIVASAGNNSANRREVQPMNAPASYPFVMGVTATDKNGMRACYANQGDIAAPGGDGNATCTAVSESDSVVSLVKTPDNSDSYARWVGTSFAAPWVSGLAALVQQQEACQIEPERVNEMITTVTPGQTPDLDESIITLPDTLIAPEPAPEPSPEPSPEPAPAEPSLHSLFLPSVWR